MAKLPPHRRWGRELVWGFVRGGRRIRWERRSYTLSMIRRVRGVLSIVRRLGLRVVGLSIILGIAAVVGLHSWLHGAQMGQG